MEHGQRQRLTDDLFLKVFDDVPTRTLVPGEPLVNAGEPADSVFVVLDGMLMLSRAGIDGRRQVLAFLFRDHFVGLTASEHYFFSAEAVTASRVACCARQRLMQYLTDDPDAIMTFMNMTFRVLEDMLDFIYSLGQRSAEERLAVFILYLRHRRKIADRLAEDAAELNAVPLPMSREDIADFLGLKKETVSRSFRALESRRALKRLAGNQVRIMSLDTLRGLAGVQDFSSPRQPEHG